jgi:glycerol-3-phosphate dehydrogenase (NAD+)
MCSKHPLARRPQVARDEFCEATIGCAHAGAGETWRACFHRPSFNVSVVCDVAGVELCGALKNVVALGAGFCDGVGFGANTKAAIVRLGLREMQAFSALFFSGVKAETYFESCGMADLITTCYGGRNRKCAEAFARLGRGARWEAIEAELLNGQKLQGTLTCQHVHACLVAKGLDAQGRFPLLEAIYAIAFEQRDPATIVQLTNDRCGERGAL